MARVLRVDLDSLLSRVELLEQGRVRSSRAYSRSKRLPQAHALELERLRRRLSPLAISLATGIPTGRLLKIEGGSDPSLLELVRLCRYYGIRPSDLLGSGR